jgi:MarR family transcriptional regulator, transcriptional regulator for hemolysin
MNDFPRQSTGIGVSLQETARAWRLKLDQRLRPLGLSQAKWRTIMLVAHAGEGITQKELAELLGVEGPTLVRLLDRLAGDGWVERRDCQHDRRSKRVYLLDRSRETLKQIEAIAGRLREEILEGIGDTELKQCLATLERIKARAETLT